MGPWWFSQFDAVHEVSQAAKRSFQVTYAKSSTFMSKVKTFKFNLNRYASCSVFLFPLLSSLLFTPKQAAFPVQEKRLDALMLCTDDVFMYLEENLKLTPQSMSDKAVALDELQEMHQQVCIISHNQSTKYTPKLKNCVYSY